MPESLKEETRIHKIKMPQWAIDIVLGRRGRLHVHENLDPAKTALIVVDLQNAFMVEEVAVAYVPHRGGDRAKCQSAGSGRAAHWRQGILDQTYGRRDKFDRLVQVVEHDDAFGS